MIIAGKKLDPQLITKLHYLHNNGITSYKSFTRYSRFRSSKSTSETRGGEFLQVYQETLKVNPGDYTISSTGIIYVNDTPKVQASLEKILQDMRMNYKSEKIYNPNEKNKDNDVENT